MLNLNCLELQLRSHDPNQLQSANPDILSCILCDRYVTYILTCSDILSGIEAGEEAGSDVLARKLARWLMILATWRGEGRRMRKSGKLTKNLETLTWQIGKVQFEP